MTKHLNKEEKLEFLIKNKNASREYMLRTYRKNRIKRHLEYVLVGFIGYAVVLLLTILAGCLSYWTAMLGVSIAIPLWSLGERERENKRNRTAKYAIQDMCTAEREIEFIQEQIKRDQQDK